MIFGDSRLLSFSFSSEQRLNGCCLLALPFPRKREGTWVLCVSICYIIYFI